MWEKVKLGELVKITKGKKHTPSDSGEFRYINIEDLHNPSNSVFTNEQGTFVNKNDVIIAWDGANAGKVGIRLEGVIGSTLAKLGLIKNSVSSYYLFWFLKSIKEVIKSQRTGATIPHVNGVALRALEIPLPPLPIQEKIAEILDKADELRRKDQDLRAKYDELAQAIFIDMFGDPVRNEKGWEVKKLEEVVGFKTGPFGSLLHKEDYIENGVPVINPTHIIDSKIQPDYNFSVTDEKFSELKAYTVKHNDILIGRRGEMGRCGIVNESMLPMLCGTGCFIINNSEKKIKSKYLHRVMTSISVKEYLEHEAIGVTMKNLNTKILKKLTIGIPPITLQETFAKKIELINQLKAQTNAEKSEQLFQSLLQKAFKGELVS